MTQDITIGSYVTVTLTGESGRVTGFDHDGTSGTDFVRVALDSGRSASVPLDDVALDGRYAQPATGGAS